MYKILILNINRFAQQDENSVIYIKFTLKVDEVALMR